MKDYAIGVFDSGVGGLTAVNKLNELLPNEDIIYFGDTARIPYGSRSKETVIRYTHEDIEFLKKHKIKMIIAACGTVSSVIGDVNEIDGIPFTGVLFPAVQEACRLTKNGRIGVIGTPATIRSGAYAKAIKTLRPSSVIIGNACPLFVHLVENGYTARDNEITKLVAKEYLEPIKNENVDTLILGCTHYPIISEIISDYMGSDVKLVSPACEAAKYAEMCLMEKGLLSNRTEKGKNTFYVSDSVELFRETAKNFLGENFVDDVSSVSL